MRFITRIHLADCGYSDAYFPGTTMTLFNPRDGRAQNTILNIENSGGKTTLLSLLFSCFDTSEKRFLKTMINKSHKFHEYFWDRPAFILVEWNISGGQQSVLGEEQRLITGQVITSRASSTETERRFFVFRSTPELSFDDIPALGLSGYDEQDNCLKSRNDVDKWIYDMRRTHQGNFQDFQNQADWKHKLMEEKIDTDLLSNQVDFNRDEGGIEEFLKFKHETEFVLRILKMVMKEDEDNSIRHSIKLYVDRLRDLPIMRSRVESLSNLKGHFHPFSESAAAWQKAKEERDAAQTHADSVMHALNVRIRKTEGQLTELNEETNRLTEEVERVRGELVVANVQRRSAEYELLGRELAAAKQKYKTTKSKLDDKTQECDLLRAALAMRDIVYDRDAIRKIEGAIASQSEDLEPRRSELRQIGSNLRASYNERAHQLRDQKTDLSGKAAEYGKQAEDADKNQTLWQEKLMEASKEAAKINENIVQANKVYDRLVSEGVINKGESAEDAAARHEKCADNARKTADKADAGEKKNADQADKGQTDLNKRNQDKIELETRINTLRNNIAQAERSRDALSSNEELRYLSGDAQIDIDNDATKRLLTDEISKLTVNLRESERHLELINSDGDSIAEYELAAIDSDTHIVVDRLRRAGVLDALPCARYLHDIKKNPAELRKFCERYPAKFTGVTVPNRNKLARAREVLEADETLQLSRPVMVSILPHNEATNGLTDDGASFVLAVTDDAAYDPQVAKSRIAQLDDEAKQIEQSMTKQRGRLDVIEKLLQDIDSWRQQYGYGKVNQMRRDLIQEEKQLTTCDKNIGELETLIKTFKEEAVNCVNVSKERASDAVRHDECARQARGYHADMGSFSETWQQDSNTLKQTIQDAEENVEQYKEEASKLRKDKSRCEDDMKQAEKDASEHENRLANITYFDEGQGEAKNNLDELSHNYNQSLMALKGLEEKKFGKMRGRLEEKQEQLKQKDDNYTNKHSHLPLDDVLDKSKTDNLNGLLEQAEKSLTQLTKDLLSAKQTLEQADKTCKEQQPNLEKKLPPEKIIPMDAESTEELKQIVLNETRNYNDLDFKLNRAQNKESQAGEKVNEITTQIKEYTHCHDLIADAVEDGPNVGTTIIIDLPEADNIGIYTRTLLQNIRETNGNYNNCNTQVKDDYSKVIKFVSSDKEMSRSEAEIVANLRANDEMVAAANATTTIKLIEDRIISLEHDINNMNADMHACLERMERAYSLAQNIFKRMARVGEIPENVPRFGKHQVFRMRDISRSKEEARKNVMKKYIDDMVNANSVPVTTQDIAAELLYKVAATLGHDTLGIKILKPKGQGEIEYMPIDKVTASGGEGLTCAMMIYLVIARMRQESYGVKKGASEMGVLILDNPLGKANKPLLLKTQMGLADKMGIQLLYTTGVQDTSALGEFENIVRLRRTKTEKNSGFTYVEVAHSHIEKTATNRATSGNNTELQN